MKIYTKLVIDMTTDEILEEESFEYSGPVAQCGGSGGGGGSSVPANTTNITTVREAPGIEERKLGINGYFCCFSCTTCFNTNSTNRWIKWT
jgi:hypothetical protein